VQPILVTSRFLWRWIDRGIDLVVGGVGGVTKGVGWVGSLVQTGSVNTYAFVLTAGVLVILWFTRF